MTQEPPPPDSGSAAALNALFDIDLAGTDRLREEERYVLLRLLATATITEAQAHEALAVHRRTGSPLLDILGASGALRQRDYAAQIAAITSTGFGSPLVGTPELGIDARLAHQFSPATLMRFLFFPLAHTGTFTTVLAVNPDDPAVSEAVQAVLPGTEVIALAATERDVTRLMDAAFGPELTFQAVHGLRLSRPEESGSRVFTGPQIVVCAVVSVLVVSGVVLAPDQTFAVLLVGAAVVYSVSVAFKSMLAFVGALVEGRVAVTDADIAALDERDLPLYSVLVPVYREPEVVPTLLAALRRLDYPLEKLDVLLLVEADDEQTITAAKAADPPPFFRFVYIPPSLPRTKPKACNYGLPFCRGQLVTIYDAEDIPAPDQLKKAVVAFRTGPESLVCVQAALNYFNPYENYLTRMFTLEYSYWFDYMLPGLDRLKLPIPLGGTSNHFRIDRLRGLNAWDPFNVTEDADLGIRASARGYTVGVVNSTTYEEANKAPRNWIRQRSRWIKGYMQTWLVHNRHPIRLLRQIGLVPWLSYQLFIGGSVATFLINPLLWLCFLAWLVFQPGWLEFAFAGWVAHLSLFNFLVGNMLGIYLSMLAVFRRRLFGLTLYALTNPFYWLLHSAAAYMALWQLFTKPFYWEKTDHGLTSVHSQAMLADAPTAETSAAGPSGAHAASGAG